MTETNAHLEPTKADEQLAAIAKALGHPLRVKILRRLIRRGSCVCGDLVDATPVAQSTVSQHLKILKDAGLVQGEVEGTSCCYCADPRGVARLAMLVGELE